MNDLILNSMHLSSSMNKVVMLLGLVAGWLFGGWSTLLSVFITVQILDIITGILVALKDKELSSTIMREGLFIKIGYWLLIVLSHLVDLILFEGNTVVISGVLFLFISNEGLSITENLGNIGVPIPQDLLKYLKQIKDKTEMDSDSEQ